MSNIAVMADDASWVAEAMTASVPWVTTAGIRFGAITTESAVATLPDRPEQRNHVDGPHAAVLFGVGETASGAVALAAFGSTMDRATPLVVRSDIGYVRLAKGPITAEAVLERPAAEVMAELDAGVRPEFTVGVVLTDGEGRETTRMRVVWTLRPHRG